MNMDEDRVKKIIISIIKENDLPMVEHTGITNDTILTDDLGFDSFNLAQLTVEIESEFDVDIFENGVILTYGEILFQLK